MDSALTYLEKYVEGSLRSLFFYRTNRGSLFALLCSFYIVAYDDVDDDDERLVRARFDFESEQNVNKTWCSFKSSFRVSR